MVPAARWVEKQVLSTSRSNTVRLRRDDHEGGRDAEAYEEEEEDEGGGNVEHAEKEQ